MNTIKALTLGFGVIALLTGCHSKEKARLQTQVDSLRIELQASRQVENQMAEINALIDSIDASRKVLRVDVVEGTSYDNYSARLKDINQYIKDTQKKIKDLEKTARNMRSLSSNLQRLKADLEVRTNEIAALQMEVSRMRTENEKMQAAIAQKDSMLMSKEDLIKIKDADITAVEASLNDANEQHRQQLALLYFQQAQTMEEVADRTNFAPRKKKQAIKDAIELYKISLELGKEEASEKIKALQEKLG